MTELMIKDNVIAFIGPDESCLYEALVASAWNLPMISYVSEIFDNFNSSQRWLSSYGSLFKFEESFEGFWKQRSVKNTVDAVFHQKAFGKIQNSFVWYNWCEGRNIMSAYVSCCCTLYTAFVSWYVSWEFIFITGLDKLFPVLYLAKTVHFLISWLLTYISSKQEVMTFV